MVEQHFCLRWNNYRNNITAEFETLREAEDFVDVTLACDGKQLKAHKVVLSACSPYFKELLQGNPCSHPIIILRDVSYHHMRSLLEFMYQGEVNISQMDLGDFLQAAEALKIRGLAEKSDDRNDSTDHTSNLSTLKASLNSLRSRSSNIGQQLLDRGSSSQETHSSQSPMLLPSHGMLGLSYPPPVTTGLASPVDRGPELGSGVYSATKSDVCERKETISPLSLPPNKRLRVNRGAISASKLNSTSPHNGCSTSSETAISKSGIAPLEISGSHEEYTEAVPKVEPTDAPVSDEGSSGWMEDEGGGTGELSRSPGTGHPNQWNPSTPGNSSSEISEPPSHVLSAPESHIRDENSHLADVLSHATPSREVPRSCPYCSKLISNFYNLKKHITTMHQAPTYYHPCQHCSATFRTPEYLRKHLVNVHKYPVKKKK